MKSECGNGLTRFFRVAASHKQCHNLLMWMRLLTRTMKETDDDESDGNRNELMTTMMRTKRMMRMMRMMGMMGMMRMRMRMRMEVGMEGEDEDDDKDVVDCDDDDDDADDDDEEEEEEDNYDHLEAGKFPMMIL